MSCSSLNNNFDEKRLEKLGLLEIQSNQAYISRLIENNIKNAFDVYNTNKSNLKISFERIAFIFFIFFLIAIIFSSKVILLSLEKKIEIKKISKKENFRASILDKDGNILAKSVPTTNVGINPNLVIDKEKLLITLKLLFPSKNFRDKMYGKKFL